MDARIQKAIDALETAQKTRTPIGPVSDLFPGGLSLEDAHRICEGSMERRLASGDRLAGFKVGFTNAAVREKMGFPDATYGYVLESGVLKNGARLTVQDFIDVKIECEICFKMAKDLAGDHLSVEEVLAATEGVGGAFEICDARIRDWKAPFPDLYADNAFGARIVLSGTWRAPGHVDLVGEKVVLSQDGKAIAEGRGEMAMGHPAKAVSWLATRLHARGKALKSGQVVMTGTLTPITPAQKGTTYTAAFSTLGEVRVTFA
jgi:2-keto-4-pentenoate hydratase